MGVNRVPKTWESALAYRANESLIPYQGGTDLMVRGNRVENYLFLNQIPEIATIEMDGERVVIGAGVTYTQVLHSDKITPLFVKIVEEIASPALRNLGSIVGNVCNGSPVGDTLPLLYVYDAMIHVEGERGKREVPIQDFIHEARDLDLREDELVRSISYQNHRFDFERYQKIGPRKACSISKVDVVFVADVDGDVITDVRIAIGAVYKTIVRSRKIEERMIGKTKQEIKTMIPSLVKDYDQMITPVDDKRSTEAYRRSVVQRTLTHFLQEMTD